jgi:hypothetical protein
LPTSSDSAAKNMWGLPAAVSRKNKNTYCPNYIFLLVFFRFEGNTLCMVVYWTYQCWTYVGHMLGTYDGHMLGICWTMLGICWTMLNISWT